jgi:hypothetical protein
MQYEQTTVSTGRITKQGVRDLNHYGPRRAKEVAAEAPPAAAVADEQTGPEAGPPATSGASDDGEVSGQ